LRTDSESIRIYAMKAWQIFAVGVGVLVAAALLPAYEGLLAGAAAVAVIAVVVFGFLLRPRRDTFYLRTTLVMSEPDFALTVEHDRIAIRVELARLWFLFLPTLAAIAFLIVTSARGTTWDFSVLDSIWKMGSYPVILIVRLFLALYVGILSTWVSERWVRRDAEACSADSVSTKAGTLLYSFRDQSGGYYGGEGFPFALVRSPKLARIVFYRSSKPEMSKIAMALLFHNLVILGRGLTELDESTVTAHSANIQPASQPI